MGSCDRLWALIKITVSVWATKIVIAGEFSSGLILNSVAESIPLK